MSTPYPVTPASPSAAPTAQADANDTQQIMSAFIASRAMHAQDMGSVGGQLAQAGGNAAGAATGRADNPQRAPAAPAATPGAQVPQPSPVADFRATRVQVL